MIFSRYAHCVMMDKASAEKVKKEKKMRRLKIWMIAGAAMMLAACGQKEETAPSAAETVQETESEAAETAAEESEAAETVAEESETAKAAEETAAEESGAAEVAEETAAEEGSGEGAALDDNFSVPAEEAEAFAGEVKQAVADADLEALADLAAYPLYLGLGDGVSVESREEFLALDAAEVFTEELKNAVAQADETALAPSMAGFVLSDENGRPNVIFGLRDGALAVSGINY